MNVKKVLSAAVGAVMSLTLLTANVSADYGLDGTEQDQSAFMWDELTDDYVFPDEQTDADVEYSDMGEVGYNLLSDYDDGISSRSAINITATIKANKTQRSNHNWVMKPGDAFQFNLTFSPELSNSELKIGIYDLNTGATTYLNHDDGAIHGFYTIKKSGNYKLEFKNNTSQDVYVSGSTVAIFFIDVGVPFYKQEKGNWCWAACVQMIAGTYNYTTTQTAIVNEIKGEIIDDTGTPLEIKSAIEYATVTTHSCSGSYSDLKGISNLSAGIFNSKPVIIYKPGSSGSSGHVSVVTAVDDESKYVRFNNPANNGPLVVTYDSLVNTSQYKRYMTVE